METPPKSIISGRDIFTPYVLEALGVEFLNEDLCRRWIIGKLHPETFSCFFCGSPAKDFQLDALREGKRINCRSCLKLFNAFTGTCLAGIHCKCSEVIMMLLFIDAGWTTRRIAVKLGRDEDTVGRWRKRITG